MYRMNLMTTKYEYEQTIWYNNMACLHNEEYDRIQIKHYGTYRESLLGFLNLWISILNENPKAIYIDLDTSSTLFYINRTI